MLIRGFWIGAIHIMAFRSHVTMEKIAEWVEANANVNVVFTYMQVPDALITSVCEAGGFDPEEDVSILAYTLDSEWEDLLSGLTFNDAKLALGLKSKLRQVLLACRKVAQATEDDVPKPAAAQE